jgi:hypothetical protein
MRNCPTVAELVVRDIIHGICKQKLRETERVTVLTSVHSEKAQIRACLPRISRKFTDLDSFFKGLRGEFDRLSRHSVEFRKFFTPIAEKVIAQKEMVRKTLETIATLTRVVYGKWVILLSFVSDIG